MPNWFSFWALKMVFSELLMAVADMLGLKMVTFGPRFGVLDPPGQAPVPPPVVPVVKTWNSHRE